MQNIQKNLLKILQTSNPINSLIIESKVIRFIYSAQNDYDKKNALTLNKLLLLAVNEHSIIFRYNTKDWDDVKVLESFKKPINKILNFNFKIYFIEQSEINELKQQFNKIKKIDNKKIIFSPIEKKIINNHFQDILSDD